MTFEKEPDEHTAAPLGALEAYAEMIRVLNNHGVKFVVIGGLAAIAHGSTLATNDIDITPQREVKNLVRLVAALNELGAEVKVHDGPNSEVIDQIIDDQWLRMHDVCFLRTEHGDLDIVTNPAGIEHGYESLRKNAIVLPFMRSVEAPIAALDDLIQSKRAANRPKDRAALPAIERLRDRLGGDHA